MISERYEADRNGCWLWAGAIMKANGYGELHVPGSGKLGRVVTAHRASWEQHRGPIPEGVLVLHKCDVRRCVNPDHLFLGSQRDNMLDMSRKARCAAKLTKDHVLAIKSDPRPRRVVAKEYGIAGSSVSRIKNGQLHAAWTLEK